MEKGFDFFFKTTKELKKLDEVNNAGEMIKNKKNAFKAWSKKINERIRLEKVWGIDS